MSEEKTTVKSSGIGFLGLLTILFIGLRLTGFIDWAWYWLIAPLWMPVALVLAIVIVGALVIGLIKIVGATVEKLSRR